MGKESAACRVCMKKSKESIDLESIFVRKPRITYLEGYNICTQLNAMIDDDLPKNLCLHCRDELKAAFRFMEKAKETDKRLRENLGVHRITRSSRRIKQEESSIKAAPAQPQDETIFEEIKTEFINCTKDPLEDSDVEADEKSEDEIEMSWVDTGDNQMETDGFAESKPAAVDDDEDDDDKPLKDLIKREKPKPVNEEPTKINENFDSSDVFNDFPEPDNYSSDDEGAFNDKMVEQVPNPPTTSEAQIFPQGRYLCKICQKTYFTAAGLKAHIAVHMPKKKKEKRVRGPNKKKGKNKKKSPGDGEDEDEEEADDHKDDDSEPKKKDEAAKAGEKDNSITKGDESTTAEPETATDGKKKRKSKAPKPKKMFPCHVCGKHMISASKLRYHMVMHTGEKDYLCTMCPKAYSTIYALKHHMRTHTGERPYECKFCGDKFTRPTTLKSHMRRHTGERPYGCDICGKRFIQHSSMTTHMKLNHMAKTIACPHCDKKYARQTDLNTHLLSHTGDKPFSCELCPSRFIRQANLNKHMNQHHSTKSNAAANALVATTSIQLTKSLNQHMAKSNTATESAASAPTTIADNQMSEHMNQHHATKNSVATAGTPAPTNNHMPEQMNPHMSAKSKPIISANIQIAEQTLQQNPLPRVTTQSGQLPLILCPRANQNQPSIHRGLNGATTSNQIAGQSMRQLPPLPRVVSVRSLAKPVQGPAPTSCQMMATPPGSVGNEESNSSNHSNHMLPPALGQQPSQHQQQHLQQQSHMQQSHMGPPHTTSNENGGIPMSMNIERIPGGIPTHNMMGAVASAGRGTGHITAHDRLESVEPLVVIHPQVDNPTNFLGQAIDPERIGRSVDDIMRWNWPNAS